MKSLTIFSSILAVISAAFLTSCVTATEPVPTATTTTTTTHETVTQPTATQTTRQTTTTGY